VPPADVAIDQQVLTLQRLALNPLMSDTVAQRLLNNELKVTSAAQALRLAELYTALHAAVFSELKTGKDIPLIRRNLQRDMCARCRGPARPNAAMPPTHARLLAPMPSCFTTS
jgi:hypothetical protein